MPNLSVVGSSAGRTPPAEHPAPAGRALVCFCEDVHADEIRAQIAAGYGDPELVKRRTGALTGPCQGKYCLQAFAGTAMGAGAERAGLPTTRPPLRPVRLGDLVARDEP
jgi:bacterioferritin-associated ferredoxin